MPSTVVAHYRYDPEKLILTVQFVSGLIYEYLDVPAKVYEEMMLSRSKGIYLNKYIKGSYDYKKITP